ncbi:hypothetical protein LEP1GSC163_2817 [Leptospira santarosai str. CBC379]|uniref:Uncharacterized protein n=1 Tax=Leptospira santarosai str. MOR084 TaxID=1049984 RepID=A0A0E2BE72_9LEPT|nr:hypothetical protein [Leptospira santarosai]EKO33504.1 hypothetical protein LEP1GSC179_2694 [Leptospira santarosai str. MOR084]EKR91716.1 hypothetical protein LEP1GSC163_2817 [Leptospira santarosai str. CBC379]
MIIPEQKNKVQGTKSFSIARALIRVAFLASLIYSTYCVHVIVTDLTPQPIYRKSETPQSYSDIFSSTRGGLCAPIVHHYSIYMSDRYEVCFLRLSAKDADWIRQKFASVKLGHLTLSDGSTLSRSQEVGASPLLNLSGSLGEIIDTEERVGTYHWWEEYWDQEYKAPGMVFLKGLTLQLWIDGMNPNDMIEYLEWKRDCCWFGFTSGESYYIPLQGNFLFYISEHHSHSM